MDLKRGFGSLKRCISLSFKGEDRRTQDSLGEYMRTALSIPFDVKEDRFVVMSDVHRGNRRDEGDDFRHNENLYCQALGHYLDDDFSLVLAGDVEEGWEFNYATIINAYRDPIYDLERQFVEKGTYYRIFGNHDSDWVKGEKVDNLLKPVLGEIEVYPALLIGERILVAHGHQGDFLSDVHAWFSRPFNKHAWNPIGQNIFGAKNTLRTAYSNKRRDGRDESLYKWARANGILLIAGHTHRGMFESYSKVDRLTMRNVELQKDLREAADESERLHAAERLQETEQAIKASEEGRTRPSATPRLGEKPVPCYFNVGCCVFTDGMTAIEIDRGVIRFVKWEYSTEVAAGDRRPPVSANRLVYESGDLQTILSDIEGNVEA